MKRTIAGFASLLCGIAALLVAAGVSAGFGSSVPVSAELVTNMARSMFPQALALGQVNLFLSEPTVLYPDARRVAVRMRVQAYDHRPEQGVALSEEGVAMLSGVLGYDRETRQVLLYDPQLDELSFANDNAFTRKALQGVHGEWQARVSNPVRAEVPPHPYLQPFRNGIVDVSYGEEGIVIQVWYE